MFARVWVVVLVVVVVVLLLVVLLVMLLLVLLVVLLVVVLVVVLVVLLLVVLPVVVLLVVVLPVVGCRWWAAGGAHDRQPGIIGPAAGGIVGPAAGGIIGPVVGGIVGPAAGKSLYYNRVRYKTLDSPSDFCVVKIAQLHGAVFCALLQSSRRSVDKLHGAVYAIGTANEQPPHRRPPPKSEWRTHHDKRTDYLQRRG